MASSSPDPVLTSSTDWRRAQLPYGMTNNTAAWPYDEFFSRVIDILRERNTATG
jgi:hypothetical protein